MCRLLLSGLWKEVSVASVWKNYVNYPKDDEAITCIKEYKFKTNICKSMEELNRLFFKAGLRSGENDIIIHHGADALLKGNEIKRYFKLHKGQRILFDDLFDEPTKIYFVITFLAILDFVNKDVLTIEQDGNFEDIYLKEKESGA